MDLVERLAGDVAGGGLAVDVLLGAAERVLVTVIGELGGNLRGRVLLSFNFEPRKGAGVMPAPLRLAH